MNRAGYRVGIHGGCGMITRDGLGRARERAVRKALRDIAGAAADALRRGRAAVDVAVDTVVMLEDCQYFNAGFGSVLNAEGEVETDAAVMSGTDLSAGAVAALRGIRNPVRAARAVMDGSDHSFLSGAGARAFSTRAGLAEVESGELVTAERRNQLERARAGGRVSLDHDEQYGTVGAVIRDSDGRLAAATSTGGMTNKHPGRIGDSPVIGAGTWADDRTCAISGTGHGEYYLRTAFAHAIHARMLYGGMTLDAACQDALADVKRLGGNGGVIAVDREGNLALPFNTTGMYRAWLGADGEPVSAIFPGE